MQIPTITTANRTAAKRLLNTWYDSRAVRVMKLAQLQLTLQRAINEGLITAEGAHRAINPKSNWSNDRKAESSNEHDRDHSNDDDRDSEQNSDGGSDGGESNDSDGESQSEGESQSDDNSGDESDAQSDDQSNEKSDGESDSESDSEDQEQGESNDSESNSEGDDDDSDSDDSESEQESEAEYEFDEMDPLPDEHAENMKEMQGESDYEEQEQQENDSEQDDGPLRHHMFATVLKWIRAGCNVALVGPAGTGKSTIAEQVAEELGLEFRATGALLSKYDLVGYCDASGTYHETPLYQAYVDGMLFNFDELDGSSPDAVVAFNAITDNQKHYAFPNGMQTKHDDFVAVACMNTWGNGATADYVGRYKQDAASMSRFVKVFIDYDVNIEAVVAGKHKDVAQRVWDLREACETLGLRHIVSTRMIVQAVAGRAVKATKKEIDRDVLFAGLDDSQVTQVKAQMNTIMRDRKAASEATS
jgi:MoxR-like ATPase